MHFSSSRQAACVFGVLLLVFFCFAEASAQKTRTKRSRRVTNPVRTTATVTPTPSAPTNEPRIISTADENSADVPATTNGRRTNSRRTVATESEADSTRKQVDKLSAQVNALNEKLSLMEQQQRTLVDLERLTRAEARAETLRAQLRDVQTKESDMQQRLEQLDYELQPSVIERTLAVTGSTRPEELRELRRRQLESEKGRVQAQLNQLTTSRARLETAIANADAEADRIRARVDAATAPPAEAATTSTDVGAPTNNALPPEDTNTGEP